jgi:tape measure domain-containing protein
MAKLKDLKVTIGLSKKGLTKLNGDIRRMKGNFRRNFGEISGMASRLGGMLVSAVGAGLTAVIKSGAKLQTLEVGFRSIMGGAEEASKMVAKLNDFTASTPFQLEEVARSARQLLAVGTAADEVNGQLRMLGDIAAASGNSISDIAAAFAKVQAKGKVELENLNQLAERGIPIFDELRKVTGNANMEFGAGAVSVDEYNQALANMAAEGGFASDAMANLSETVDGKLSTAFDNVTLALGKFAEESGLLETVTNILDDFTAGIQHMTLSTDDLQKSRDDVYELRQAFKEATKDNVQGLRDQVRAAEIFATTLQTKLGEEAVAGHLAGIRALKDEIDEAMAFGTLPAGAPPAQAAPPAAVAKEEKKVKEQLLEVEKSRLLTLGMINEMQATTAVDILAAAQANHTLKGSIQAVQAAVIPTKDALVAMGEYAATQLPGFFENAFGVLMDGTQSFGQYMMSVLESLLKKLAAMLAAFGAMSVLFPGSAAVKGGLGKFLAGGFNIPAFAAGGLVSGATLAMVGEGAGTSLTNPEVIAPLDKLQQMMGGNQVQVTGVIRGQDILLTNERAQIDRNRLRSF